MTEMDKKGNDQEIGSTWRIRRKYGWNDTRKWMRKLREKKKKLSRKRVLDSLFILLE